MGRSAKSGRLFLFPTARCLPLRRLELSATPLHFMQTGQIAATGLKSPVRGHATALPPAMLARLPPGWL
jgi:hypothetical protein